MKRKKNIKRLTLYKHILRRYKTITAAAKAAGIERTHLYKILNGEIQYPGKASWKLSQALGVPIERLFPPGEVADARSSLHPGES